MFCFKLIFFPFFFDTFHYCFMNLKKSLCFYYYLVVVAVVVVAVVVVVVVAVAVFVQI